MDTNVKNNEPTWTTSAVLSIAILLVAGGLAVVWFTTEPTAKRGGASKETAMLVDVVEAEQGTFRPTISVQGTVRASKDIILRPQVGGKVTSIAPEFTPGGDVKEGERLVSLQSEDYRNTLAQRKSELEEAKSQLAVEKGKHEAAKAEYERFGEKLSAAKKARVLRKPQLRAAKQRVKAARAAVEQAKLNVRRTTIESPFDAQIVRRAVNVGSEVSSGDSLARLVGIDRYWISVELPLSKMKWLNFPGKDQKGSPVKIRNQQSWTTGAYREGYLFKRVGILDEDTRMAKVLVNVSDPLVKNGSKANNRDKPALIIGEFVDIAIKGKPLKNVVRLDREYLRKDQTVWVMDDNDKLQVKDVELALRDKEYAYISDGIDGNTRVITTSLTSLSDGAPLRLESSDEEQSSE